MTTWSDIARRAEAAEGADRELDRDITLMLHPELTALPATDIGGWEHPRWGRVAPSADYTASLDACLGLMAEVPPDHGFWINHGALWSHYDAEVQRIGEKAHLGVGATAALALLAAIAKAMAAKEPAPSAI